MIELKSVCFHAHSISSFCLSFYLSVILISSLSLLSFVSATTAAASASDNDHCIELINFSSSSPTLPNHNQSISQLCKCPPDKPVRLSPEIPCQRRKALGEVCLHSSECEGPHSACVAALLYPVELHTIPNYRSWYIYNQITGSDDLNYLLNKVYGQCRCKAGFRSSSNRTCVARDFAQTNFNCSIDEFPDPCTSLVQHSRCTSGYCQCERGRLYNQSTERCYFVSTSYHGQFCVTSGDCQSSNDADHQLHCSKGRCSCALGFRYSFNASGCISLRRCDLGFFWNRTTARCEPLSEMSLFYNSLLLKIFLLLLVNLFVLNLIRYACYSRFFQAREVALPFRDDDDDLESSSSIRNRTFRHQHRAHRTSSGHHSQLCRSEHCTQSQSLLSLPPYDLLYNTSPSSTNGRDLQQREDDSSTPSSISSLAPPSYDEAMRSKASDNSDNLLQNCTTISTVACNMVPAIVPTTIAAAAAATTTTTTTTTTSSSSSSSSVSLCNIPSTNSSNSVHNIATYSILKNNENDDASNDRENETGNASASRSPSTFMERQAS